MEILKVGKLVEHANGDIDICGWAFDGNIPLKADEIKAFHQECIEQAKLASTYYYEGVRKLLYDDLILDLEVVAGRHIRDVLEQMITLRNRMAINVRAEVNGVKIFVCRDDQTVESLYKVTIP